MSSKELVGTALSRLIPKFFIKDNGKGGCSCNKWEKKMNRWGIEGCERNRDVIVDHLCKQEDHLIPMLARLPAAIKRFGAESLLDHAIKLVKKETSKVK